MFEGAVPIDSETQTRTTRIANGFTGDTMCLDERCTYELFEYSGRRDRLGESLEKIVCGERAGEAYDSLYERGPEDRSLA